MVRARSPIKKLAFVVSVRPAQLPDGPGPLSMPSSLLGAHPAAASGGETPDETKPDKEGWDKPGEEALSFKDRTTLRATSKLITDRDSPEGRPLG